MNWIIDDYLHKPTRDELNKRKAGALSRIGVTPWEHRYDDPTIGVAGSTFRALRNLPVPPSEIYRSWATAISDRNIKTRLKDACRSQQAFLRFHERLAIGLQRRWRNQAGTKLSVAHQYKLVDLYIKWLSRHDFASKAITRGLIAHAHCALDSVVLKALNRLLSDAMPIGTPSMKSVGSIECYGFCQRLAREATRCCDLTPLVFDFIVWNIQKR